MCLHALVKDTSESRALILEGREFHSLPVEYSKKEKREKHNFIVPNYRVYPTVTHFVTTGEFGKH